MRDITLKEALDEYTNVYMAYRNFAERTREEYQNDLEGFILFLEKLGVARAREIGLPIIERFVADLEHKGFASLTRKRKVVSVRSFLLFLYEDGYIETNIAKKIILPFTESTTPNILTQTECQLLSEACADNLRDKAIIELLLQTGIKLSELTRLTLNDIDLESSGDQISGFVRVLGSRAKKDRIIPLNTVAYQAVNDYLVTREGSVYSTLFLNRFGKPLGDRGVQKVFRKYLAKAGIGKASIQTLRHTFGAFSVALGNKLKTIRENLGLKDARSTYVYLPLAKNVLTREM